MALDSTHPLIEMGKRISPGGEGGKSYRSVGLTTLPPSRGDCCKFWEPNLLESEVLTQIVLQTTHLRSLTYMKCAWGIFKTIFEMGEGANIMSYNV
jgi:hypothetical protein